MAFNDFLLQRSIVLGLCELGVEFLGKFRVLGDALIDLGGLACIQSE